LWPGHSYAMNQQLGMLDRDTALMTYDLVCIGKNICKVVPN